MKSRTKEFIKKLQTLLREYNACISLESDPGSDWHGITGERTTVSVDKDVVVIAEYETYISSANMRTFK